PLLQHQPQRVELRLGQALGRPRPLAQRARAQLPEERDPVAEHPSVRRIRQPQHGPRDVLEAVQPFRRPHERPALPPHPPELPQLPEDAQPAREREKRRHAKHDLRREAAAQQQIQRLQPRRVLDHRRHHHRPFPPPAMYSYVCFRPSASETRGAQPRCRNRPASRLEFLSSPGRSGAYWTGTSRPAASISSRASVFTVVSLPVATLNARSSTRAARSSGPSLSARFAATTSPTYT